MHGRHPLSGDDVLVGDKRNNFLIGGPGRDILVGGDGADDFSYAIEDTPLPAGICRRHSGLPPTRGDRIDFWGYPMKLRRHNICMGDILLRIKCSLLCFLQKRHRSGRQPLYGDPRFEDARREPSPKAKRVSLMVDVDGDARADLMIAVWGVDSIKASDLHSFNKKYCHPHKMVLLIIYYLKCYASRVSYGRSC